MSSQSHSLMRNGGDICPITVRISPSPSEFYSHRLIFTPAVRYSRPPSTPSDRIIIYCATNQASMRPCAFLNNGRNAFQGRRRPKDTPDGFFPRRTHRYANHTVSRVSAWRFCRRAIPRGARGPAHPI
ncbi:unnamed protein product [Chondrus crispus]|uniref:Uncharacterized protein n=1 Tax=Chondrus crispus TaxID=2769 RepID=R7QE96_CHOCR|nr:unnamed protein product [Chondrus crispus]CDF35755.1 unnamed protein product [Chondrus crispus]|eukprot:XP_005715574.1 unnamed protein product [Chondrus crispus]